MDAPGAIPSRRRSGFTLRNPLILSSMMFLLFGGGMIVVVLPYAYPKWKARRVLESGADVDASVLDLRKKRKTFPLLKKEYSLSVTYAYELGGRSYSQETTLSPEAWSALKIGEKVRARVDLQEPSYSILLTKRDEFDLEGENVMFRFGAGAAIIGLVLGLSAIAIVITGKAPAFALIVERAVPIRKLPVNLAHMDLRCPKCAQIVKDPARVSAPGDIAQCPGCREMFRVSECVVERPLSAVDLTRPPSGLKHKATSEGFIIEASNRSGITVFLLPFACLLGVVAVLGIWATFATRDYFIVALSIVCSFFCWLDMNYVFGKATVIAAREEGYVYTGWGRAGWRRRIRWRDVTDITGSAALPCVVRLNGPHPFTFGSFLSKDQSSFIAQALSEHVSKLRAGEERASAQGNRH